VHMLMPSTPSAYSQVDGGRFASFRVVKSRVFPAQSHFGDGFDSRQLHKRAAEMRPFSADRRPSCIHHRLHPLSFSLN
jgi:hypothetical protein